MEIALYHPVHGYYRRQRDPFGKEGDFYTAEQIQPAFGILIAKVIRELRDEMGNPADFCVVELGAGRGEMAEALTEFRYLPVDLDGGELPERFSGIVFANEFFDALPVDVFRRSGERFEERMVSIRDGKLVWEEGSPADDAARDYLEQLAPGAGEGQILEVNFAALEWMNRIAGALVRGYVFVIDYGYTREEVPRHPDGTLMSYRRHVAEENVLLTPGDRDITAHVPFSLLEEAGARRGLLRTRFERLVFTLLRAGEPDQFAAVLAGDEAEQLRRRLQLKTLLFGMGETFRTLLLKAGQK
jgi:SAM-dependent MidA family methyltransferase